MKPLDGAMIISVESAKYELEKRRRRVHMIRIALEAQHVKGWTDEQTFAVLACYLSDQLEHTVEKLQESMLKEMVSPFANVTDGKSERYVYLGNHVRALYDALKTLEASCTASMLSGNWGNFTIDQWPELEIAREAIAKAEGKA